MNEFASASEIVGQQALSEFLDHPDLLHFMDRATSENSGQQFLSFTFPIPQFDPLACLEMLSPGLKDFHFYWEKPDQDLALSAGGRVISLKEKGSNRFQKISSQINNVKQRINSFSLIQHTLSGVHFLGGFSFFDETESSWWKPFGSSLFTIPRWLLIRDGKLGLLTITIEQCPDDTRHSLKKQLNEQLQQFEQLFELDKDLPETSFTGTTNTNHHKSDSPDPKWIQSVEDAKELIIGNKFDKIVLAREVVRQTDLPIDPTRVLNKLRSQYPSCYNFLISNNDGKVFLGSTPERLVSFQKNYLLTESLAGSISRGKTATEDVHLEKFLLNSNKNRKEHQFVTSAIEENLKPFINKIDRSEQPDVKKLKNVQHLYTPVRAWLKKDTNRFSILDKLHPTPAVGGHPREDAVPYIKILENFDRGWYAGPIGWFNVNNGGEFAVAIRSSLVDGNKARVFAGCGIVKDSDPYAEWEETNLKLMPILSALEQNDSRRPE